MQTAHHEENSELAVTLSPNGLPSDYVELRRTTLNGATDLEVRQVRDGQPGRSIYLLSKRQLLEALTGWRPDHAFGQPSHLMTEIRQNPHNRIEIRATPVGTDTRLELRQVRPTGARSIYLTARNVTELRQRHSSGSNGPDANFTETPVRCRACEQPLAYKVVARSEFSVNCSESCIHQKATRRTNEHRNSIICELAARGVKQSDLADLFGLTRPGIHGIINGF